MQCHQSCETCSQTCKPKCPKCGTTGYQVSIETIKSLVINDNNNIDGHQWYLCSNPPCDVIYFQETSGCCFSKKAVKVPVWFKSPLSEYLVCYCRKIYLNDIIDVILNSCKSTPENVEEVIWKLGKTNMKLDCLHENPLGCSCNQLFQNAIVYAYEQKNKKE